MISKLRVEVAAKKYRSLLKTLDEYNLTMSSLYLSEEELTSRLTAKWRKNYSVCGVDCEKRSVMWISAKEPNAIEEEQTVVHAGLLYWMAVHSDLRTLREGCTFVVDTTQQQGIPRVGNERKLQKTWQSLPLRPQNLFIVGASFVKRLFINALLRFASLFSNAKVLERLRFVEMDSVREKIADSEMPEYLGGEKRKEVDEWVLDRLRNWK
eukprot:g206.t1